MSLSYYKLALILDKDAGGQNGAPSQALEIRNPDNSLASIFSDEDGLVPITQPGAVTDSQGNFEFYAVSGKYKAVSGSFELEISVGLEDDDRTYGSLAEVIADKSISPSYLNKGRVQGVGDFEIVSTNPNSRYVASANGFIKPLTGNVELFGAEGDGVTDDTAAFTNASDEGFTPVCTQGKTYLVTYTSASDLLNCTGDGVVTNDYITVHAKEVFGSADLEDQSSPPRGGTIRRMMNTVEDLELFIDSGAASSGDGSQTSPFQTIGEALSFIPRNIYHKVRLYLEDGTYTGIENNLTVLNSWVTPRSTAGFKVIGHTPNNPLVSDGMTTPTAVVIGDESTSPSSDNSNLFSLPGADSDDTRVEGVTFDGRVQVYASFLSFDDCKFMTGRGGSDRPAIAGHSFSVRANNCDFEDCTPCEATDLSRFYMSGCTGTSLIRPSTAKNASRIDIETSSTVLSSAASPITQEDTCVVTVDGYQVINSNSGYVGVDGVTNILDLDGSGRLKVAGALLGGEDVVSSVDDDSFAIYQTGSGNIFIKVNSGGTEKTIQLIDFAAGTIA